MSRDRHQNGWVEPVGKQVKKWQGHWYVYVRDADGCERRKHRSKTLGLRARMRKSEANRLLRQIIDQETGDQVTAQPDDTITFDWFWRRRFLPIREKKWRRSTRATVTAVIEGYAIKRFGPVPLSKLTRFDLQKYLFEVADARSSSVVKKLHVWMKAILAEAVEQEFLKKNPAQKLDLPLMRAVCKRNLSVDEIRLLLGVVEGRDRLIVGSSCCAP